MGSSVSTAPPVRPSTADRERVAQRLRGACDSERLSLETFAARLDLAYRARSAAELGALVADLPEPHSAGRMVLAVAAWASGWTERVAEAWTRARTPRLVLSMRQSVLLGRSRDCDCVLADSTVSRRHALLTCNEGAWQLRDLASLNGTYLNGARIVDVAEVQPGDEICFGMARFRFVPPLERRQPPLRHAMHHRTA